MTEGETDERRRYGNKGDLLYPLSRLRERARVRVKVMNHQMITPHPNPLPGGERELIELP
jgi:hypothetical protein